MDPVCLWLIKVIIMRVFLNTDVLISLAGNDPESSRFLNIINKESDYSFWISAASLTRVHNSLSKRFVPGAARERITYIQDNFSMIPLRQSIVTAALEKKDTDFETAVQIASAEAFKMDCMVTHNVDLLKNTYIKTVTPDLFIKNMKSSDLDTVNQVPFLDLKAQHHQIYNEIDEKLTDIITHTGFILGKHVEEFEHNFAGIQEAKYCIGVSSGTDALHIALTALGIGPGDAVMVPVNTFMATAEAVSLCGAVPVFVDCDSYYNMDIARIREILQQRAPVKSAVLGFCEAFNGINRGRMTGREDGRRTKEESEKSRRLEGGKIRRLEDQKSRRSKTITNSNVRISAIIPVHLYGQPANMDEIMALAHEYDLMVVEDCCQAHLAKYQKSEVRGQRSEIGGQRSEVGSGWQRVGNFGAFGAFSFYPGKNLGAYGEAGALITNDKEWYETAKMIRQHGEIERYNHKMVGHNYRMAAIQGAVLATKLKYLKEWTRKRQNNARLYTEFLENVEGIQTPKELEGTDCVYHLYVIRTRDRDGLQQYLQKNGVATGLHYPIPLHLQEAYKDLGYKKGDFPVAEKAAASILSLPMYPELTEKQIRYVCDKIKAFKNKR